MPNVTQLHVNGARKAIDAEPDRSLLGVLRDDLGLTGAKYGCGEGSCGACTVLVDGQRVRSCVTRVGTVAGKKVRTVEGLAAGEKLHPVQEAFLACDAMQCGYCTPGMIMSAVALLAATPHPSEAQIVAAMDKSRNMCRCCAYPRIVAAIKTAGQRLAANGSRREHEVAHARR